MAAERLTGDFGAKLREARERKGVSLRVIADATKISVRALEALEKNDIARLPGGIFSRAFVRAYAHEVGLDPEQTIAEFITRFPVETVTQGHPRTRAIVDELEADARRTGWSPLAKAALVVVPLAALALYIGVMGRSTPPLPVETVAAAASGSPDAGSSAPRIEIALQATRATSVSIAVDGAAASTLTIDSGSIRTLSAATEVAITPADPSALQWFVNGRPARPMSGPVRVNAQTAQGFLVGP